MDKILENENEETKHVYLKNRVGNAVIFNDLTKNLKKDNLKLVLSIEIGLKLQEVKNVKNFKNEKIVLN